jgi:hypothetical protein
MDLSSISMQLIHLGRAHDENNNAGDVMMFVRQL